MTHRSVEYWLAIASLCGMAVYYYGLRALAVFALSAVTAVLTDWICLFLRKRHYRLHDLNNIGTALLLTLLLPATIPYSIVLLSTIFAIAIGTHVFGSEEKPLFSPTAVGYLFAVVSWKSQVLSFPSAGTWLPFFGNTATLEESTMAQGVGTVDTQNLLLGAVRASMGTGCLLLLLVILLVLWIRSGISFGASVGFFTAYGFWGVTNQLTLKETFGGGILLFSAIFLIGDMARVPQRELLAWSYGIAVGLLTSLLYARSSLEYAVIVAVVLCCPIQEALCAWDRVLAEKRQRILANNSVEAEQNLQQSDSKSATSIILEARDSDSGNEADKETEDDFREAELLEDIVPEEAMV